MLRDISELSDSDSVQSYTSKVVLLGDAGTGKTSIINRWLTGSFSQPITTVGVSFFTKRCKVSDRGVINLRINDTSGQERFRSLSSMYFRSSSGAILTFAGGSWIFWLSWIFWWDLEDPESFGCLKEFFLKLVETNYGEPLVLAVAANKADLVDEEKVAELIAKAKEWTDEIGAKLFITSAKTGKEIEEMFNWVVETIFQLEENKMKMKMIKQESESSLRLDIPEEKESDNACC